MALLPEHLALAAKIILFLRITKLFGSFMPVAFLADRQLLIFMHRAFV
jgi:hypothetical protein